MIDSDTSPEHVGWAHQQWPPGSREVALLTLLTGLLFVGTILAFGDYHSTVYHFGDSSAYTDITSAIRHWNFHGLQIKQFWGYPYAMAAASGVTTISDQSSLLLISFASSFLSAAFSYRLWGGWVAGLFAVLNFDWMQRSFLGGSEPLAVALIFGAFLAVRRDRYLLAALLASLSTIVRPLSIFCLIGIGVVLLYRHEYRSSRVRCLLRLSLGFFTCCL